MASPLAAAAIPLCTLEDVLMSHAAPWVRPLLSSLELLAGQPLPPRLSHLQILHTAKRARPKSRYVLS